MNVEKSFCAVSEKLLVDFTSKVLKVELCDETFLLKCVFNFNFASEILDLTKTVWANSRINFGRKAAIIFQRKRSLLGKNGRFGAKNFALRRLRHFVNRQVGNRNFVNQLVTSSHFCNDE